MPTSAVAITSVSWRCLARRYARTFTPTATSGRAGGVRSGSSYLGWHFLGWSRSFPNCWDERLDLNTPQFLSPYFRDKVLAEAEVQYAEPRH